MMKFSKLQTRGTTLPETLVGLVLLATFFASVFERAEMLRNLAFTDLTDATAVQTLMATPPNAAPFGQKATETVTISAFPTPNGVTQFTRTPAGTVTTDSVAIDLGKELVKVDVKVAWTMTLGGRSRTEQTTNILSNGSKK
jgi:hypothetical protein